MEKINYKFQPDKMCLVYFSGTGNTKIAARIIADQLIIEMRSIEEDFDFSNLLVDKETIIIMYPVYYSTPPILIRDFIKKYEKHFENKNVMSIATQMFYSGDGAYNIKEYLPDSSNLIYSRHIFMPSNISNFPILPYLENIFVDLRINCGIKKAKKISREIRSSKLILHGNTKLAYSMGNSQRKGGLKDEDKNRSNVWVDDKCIGCGICSKNCPTNNFIIENKIAIPQGRCIFCTRCENLCPQKAIRVLYDKKLKVQYRVPDKYLKS